MRGRNCGGSMQNTPKILTPACGKGFGVLIREDKGSHLCFEVNLLTPKTGLHEALRLSKQRLGRGAGLRRGCVRRTRKAFMTYRCAPRCAFFLFWNIKQKEARGLQPCYYKLCCLSPSQTRIFQYLFCHPYDHSLD